MSDEQETKPDPKTFDFDAYPKDTLFYERRTELERRANAARAAGEPIPVLENREAAPPRERRAKKERRRRIDPTTFEKQYTDDEMEFMNAMQRFKVRTGKSFPSHGEVLDVAFALGYRKPILDDDDLDENDVSPEDEFELVAASSEEN